MRVMLTPEPDLLSAEQVAIIAGVQAQTVRRWANAGKMPAPVRLGPKTLRFDPAKIADWLNTGHIPAA